MERCSQWITRDAYLIKRMTKDGIPVDRITVKIAWNRKWGNDGKNIIIHRDTGAKGLENIDEALHSRTPSTLTAIVPYRSFNHTMTKKQRTEEESKKMEMVTIKLWLKVCSPRISNEWHAFQSLTYDILFDVKISSRKVRSQQ